MSVLWASNDQPKEVSQRRRNSRDMGTAALLRLALVLVVVARWSSDTFVAFITFSILCSADDDY
jgi:hypothetical protein